MIRDRIAKKNRTLPPEIPAFQILIRVNLSKEERILVLTGMDYTKKDMLYDQEKQSLKKFKGDQTSCGALCNSNASVPIKLEPTFLASFKRGGYASGQHGSHHDAKGSGGSGQRGSHNIMKEVQLVEAEELGIVEMIGP